MLSAKPQPQSKNVDDQTWMLSSVCTRIGEQGPIVARMGHIVIHHRCRSKLVGGAEAHSGCGTTYSNSASVFQTSEFANLEIDPKNDFFLPGWFSRVLAAMPEKAALCGGMG
jgi:hypothetical protein